MFDDILWTNKHSTSDHPSNLIAERQKSSKISRQSLLFIKTTAWLLLVSMIYIAPWYNWCQFWGIYEDFINICMFIYNIQNLLEQSTLSLQINWMHVFISWWLKRTFGSKWQTLMLIFHERKQIKHNWHTNAIHLINYNLFGAVTRIHTYVSNWVENMLILRTKQQDAMRICIRFSKRLITNRMIFSILWLIYQLTPQINHHVDVCFQSH